MYAVVDLETTGRDPWRNEILTLCCIVADTNFKEVDRFNGKIKPSYLEQWSEDAENVHKITKQEADTFDNTIDVIDNFISFLNGLHSHEYRFVCHALPFRSSVDLFDRNFIFSWFWSNNRRVDYYRLFPEDKMISTIIRKRKLAQEQWGIPNQKLSTWIDKLGIDNSKHHEADFDAEVCLKVLEYQQTNQGVING